MVDSKHECLLSSTNTSMVVLKLPEREFKALLTELCTREKKASLQDYIYSVQLKKKKTGLVQASENTITHTSKLKSTSKYFEDYDFLYFTLKQVKKHVHCAVRIAEIAELGRRCLKLAATLKYEPLNSCITELTV